MRKPQISKVVRETIHKIIRPLEEVSQISNFYKNIQDYMQ